MSRWSSPCALVCCHRHLSCASLRTWARSCFTTPQCDTEAVLTGVSTRDPYWRSTCEHMRPVARRGRSSSATRGKSPSTRVTLLQTEPVDTESMRLQLGMWGRNLRPSLRALPRTFQYLFGTCMYRPRLLFLAKTHPQRVLGETEFCSKERGRANTEQFSGA